MLVEDHINKLNKALQIFTYLNLTHFEETLPRFCTSPMTCDEHNSFIHARFLFCLMFQF